MISNIFHTFLYTPIYNLLIVFTDVAPGGDIGIAVIVVTLLVKFAILPLSLSAAKTTRHMRLIEPQIKKVREKYKNNKEKLARETFALYKNNGIKPFSSILAALIQLPIVFALYLVFAKEELLHANLDLIYSIVPIPPVISPLFLNYFEITGHSIILAVIAGLTQYAVAHFSIVIPEKTTERSVAEDFGRSMAIQARFVLPIVIMGVAYISGAIALYLITASLVGLLQEFIVRRIDIPNLEQQIAKK